MLFLLKNHLICSFIFLGMHLSIYAQNKPISNLQINELGKIPIITYHKIGDTDTEYSRSREGFRSDLIYFIENKFHFLSLQEFTSGNIQAPKGSIPILMTFDDSSVSQFEMDKNGKINPNSGIGIIESLKKKYPTFRPKGVFFVTPGAKNPNDLFGQKESKKAKLEYLIANGYDIENHTLWHANLKKYSSKIEEQIVKCEQFVQEYLPNHKMSSLALPFGIYPPEAERHRLMKGNFKGVSYKNSNIFDYSNRLSYVPYHKEYDSLHIRRIHANESGIKRMIVELNKPGIAFVSDGDPSTITIPKTSLGFLQEKGLNKKVLSY
ncbi:MAG: hypothetical protein CK427_04580 [Leptospira sp.]|nr:MAG: hypothetical protein CK427_04580 [Leptospira sp.]